MRLLIVDADPVAARRLALELRGQPFHVGVATSVEGALQALREEPAEVVLIDAGLAAERGWTVLATLRKEHAPEAIVCTGQDVVGEEKAEALDRGADDFLLKPWGTVELLARIRSVQRRYRALPVLHVQGLRLDLARRAVDVGGRRVELSPRELDVLRVLAEKGDGAVSKEELLHEIWGERHDPRTTVVEVSISRLRKKLSVPGAPRIRALPEQGYWIEADGPARD